MNGLCRIPALQSQGRMNTWLSLPPWEQAPDKVHVQDRLCLSDRVSNKCPQPQAGWDGWLESCSSAHLLTFPWLTNTPTLPTAEPLCHRQAAKTSPKHQKPHQTPSQTFHSTAAEQDKTHSEIKTFTFNPKNILLLVFFWHFKLLYDVQAIFWCHIIHLHRDKSGGTLSLNVTSMWKSNLEETNRSER